jgi:hypothetical protein
MPPIEAIGSIGSSLAAKVQQADQAARLAHLERNRVVVSPATLNLPNLGRVGDRETIIVQVRDRAGALTDIPQIAFISFPIIVSPRYRRKYFSLVGHPTVSI